MAAELIVGVVVVLVIAVIVVAWFTWRRVALRRRFGPEYHRLAHQHGPAAAARELRQRQRDHHRLQLHDLDDAAKDRYRTAWTLLQSRFVDEPDATVGAADELVTSLMADRGYPVDDHDERMAHLSVDHAGTLEHYRQARDINLRHQQGRATTEEMRQALVHYRVLVADLLGADPVQHVPTRRPDDIHQ